MQKVREQEAHQAAERRKKFQALLKQATKINFNHEKVANSSLLMNL